MNLPKIIEKGWLILAVVSLLLMVYITITEGFIKGKAWIYAVLIIYAVIRSLIFRKKRLKK